MKHAAVLLAVLAGTSFSPARAEKTVAVRRGNLTLKVPTNGTVVASETVRLKAAIEGRVEDVSSSSYTWAVSGQPLGYLASKEMAAILDSHSTTVRSTIEDRWRRVYQPTPILCPSDCFVLRVFVRNKEWLKPHALLFEAAQRVQLVGRVRPEDAHWVRDNQVVEFWPKNDPKRVQRTKVQRYVLDVQASKVAPGGSFATNLSPKVTLDPGTEWEGHVMPFTRKDVLIVPTAALLDYDGNTYLAVRVSTGITSEEFTEITSGTDDKRPALVIDESKLKSSKRHHAQPNLGALEERLREQSERPVPTADGPEPDNSVPAREATTDVPSRREEPIRDSREKSGVLAEPDATYSESPNAN